MSPDTTLSHGGETAGEPASIEGARLHRDIKSRLFHMSLDPVRIGPHRVLRRLGVGGMGEVFLAHDDDLDRPIAIKLVHSKLSHDPRFADRMRREARALAKLAHPNVVHAYEIGEEAGRFYLSMEYIEGQSLGAWIRAASPGWREVLDAYLSAGEGLAAAHDAGLTHRDFKPDNVLRGDDGRICVADFGLARPSEDDPTSARAAGLSSESGDAPPTLDERLSATGTVVGTPSYMPLEQLLGDPVDARSDQFAFCVALYEGLWGKRPHAAKSLRELERTLIENRPSVPARGKVPAWVWPILRRGLERAPSKRWPDMRTLLDSLHRAPLKRRNRRAVTALALPLALAAGWLGLAPGAEDPCAVEARALDEVWNPARQAAIEHAFGSDELGWQRDSGVRVIEQIDRWSQRWIDARVEVCRTQQAEPDSPLTSRQLECLEQRRAELDGLLGIVARADASTLERAHSSVLSMADPLACEAIAGAGVGIDPPPAKYASEVVALRGELAEVEALLLAARWTEALELATTLLERAQQIDYGPVEAEIRFAQARAHLGLDAAQTGREELELAVDLAEASRHEHLALEIWLLLAHEVATKSKDVALGQGALRRFRAKLAASRREAEYAGELALAEARVALLRHQPDQAEVPTRRALAEFEHQQRVAEVARARGVLARVLESLGQMDEALEQYRQAREDVEQVYGPHHPKVASRCYNLGIALYERGQVDEARVELTHALAIWEAAPELSRADRLDGLLVLAMFEFEAERLDDARAHVVAAESLARELGDDHPAALAQIAAASGAIAYQAGDFELAMQELERAAEGFESLVGPSDPTALQTWTSHGWAALLAGHPDRAASAFARLREQLDELEGDAGVGERVHLGLAMASLMLGDADAAVTEVALLPDDLEPFHGLERDLIRAFAERSSPDAIERLRELSSELDPTERRDFLVLLAWFASTVD